MHRRTFIQQSAIAGLACWSDLPEDPLLGHGEFRYRLNREWCLGNTALFPVKNCHELAMDRRGRIFMTTDETKNNILIFNKDGKILDSWGHDYPGAHGLTLHDENGEEVLYITDYERHEVIKTRLNGQVIRIFGWPADSGKYPEKSSFKPTETAIAPNGDLLVADGYGLDYILQFSPDGVLKNMFGGPGQLKNAHGIALDNRNPARPQWLVSSRAENQLKRFDLNGELLETIELPGAFICRPVVNGKNIYFAVLISELPWDSGTGYIAILDENNRMTSAPGACTPHYDSEGRLNTMYQTIKAFRHPHDVLVDEHGNLLVTQWNSGGVYPYFLERVA